jgi:hypothetical protein
LKSYFDQIVKAHDNLGRRGMTNYGSSNVLWLQPPFATIAAHELVIYLIPAGTTLVTNGKLQQGRPPGQHDGNTNFLIPNSPPPGTTAGSEVFPNFPSTPQGLKLVASLMFHEAMHNKLALTNRQLHPQLGLASGPPETAAITDTMALTNSNINAMAASLDIARPQWTAGLSLLTQAVNVPDSDPMKGNW